MPQYLAPGVYVEEVPSAVQPIAGVGTSTAGFIGIVPDTVTVPVPNPDFDPTQAVSDSNSPALTGADQTFEVVPDSGEVRLCTNFSEFTRSFGGFSTDVGQRNLAHAVYGFFNNGGTRCFVTRVAAAGEIASAALPALAAEDEVAIVAAPGVITAAARSAIVDHCVNLEDRFAILDADQVAETDGALDLTLLDPANDDSIVPPNSNYAALYWPWLQVYDPASGILDPTSTGYQYVPPSGHMAGIYARVDTHRGVHKAPANEVVRGALNLRYRLSRADQAGLNPRGVNAIRDLNGNIRVWGARTLGGDANGEWKYLNVRRLFLFLRESIDEGTQWVVFEPNDMTLWAKISRNVTAFLTNVWRNGALLGATPEEAFYVKCDAETNPPEVRDLGMVVTEIGVAVVRPAEFVIFRISQMAPAS
jgi:phage tail sheath protein FI